MAHIDDRRMCDAIRLLTSEQSKGRCDNARCREPAGDVVLITTAHVRWFCSVECVAKGQGAHVDAIMAEVDRDLWGAHPSGRGSIAWARAGSSQE